MDVDTDSKYPDSEIQQTSEATATSTSQPETAAVSRGARLKPFKPPRARSSSTSSVQSAMSERSAAARTRAEAEALEREADAAAERAAKKARTQSLKPTVKHSKAKRAADVEKRTESASIDDFPGGDY